MNVFKTIVDKNVFDFLVTRFFQEVQPILTNEQILDLDFISFNDDEVLISGTIEDVEEVMDPKGIAKLNS